MAEADHKRCYTCKQSKPRSEFPVHRQKPDGLNSNCRPCSTSLRHAYEAEIDPAVKEARVARKADYDAANFQVNRDKIVKYQLERYRANPEVVKARVKEWGAKNPERRAAIANSYKHRRRSVERAGISGVELYRWKQAQPKVCHWCGCNCAKSPVVDHYQPLAKGGKHETSNLVISCRPCNASKAARDPLEFAQTKGRLF